MTYPTGSHFSSCTLHNKTWKSHPVRAYVLPKLNGTNFWLYFGCTFVYPWQSAGLLPPAKWWIIPKYLAASRQMHSFCMLASFLLCLSVWLDTISPLWRRGEIETKSAATHGSLHWQTDKGKDRKRRDISTDEVSDNVCSSRYPHCHYWWWWCSLAVC